MVPLTKKIKFLCFNLSQILFIDHSQSASHYISPRMEFSEAYLRKSAGQWCGESSNLKSPCKKFFSHWQNN